MIIKEKKGGGIHWSHVGELTWNHQFRNPELGVEKINWNKKDNNGQ